MTHTAAHHKGAIKMLQLRFRDLSGCPCFLYSPRLRQSLLHCSLERNREVAPAFENHSWLPFCPVTMKVKGSLPKFPHARSPLLSPSSPFLPSRHFSFKQQGQPSRVVGPSTPLCQSIHCSRLTFNSEARVKRAKEHEMGLPTGVHSDHSLSCTSISIRCPRGLQVRSPREVS